MRWGCAKGLFVRSYSHFSWRQVVETRTNEFSNIGPWRREVGVHSLEFFPAPLRRVVSWVLYYNGIQKLESTTGSRTSPRADHIEGKCFNLFETPRLLIASDAAPPRCITIEPREQQTSIIRGESSYVGTNNEHDPR